MTTIENNKHNQNLLLTYYYQEDSLQQCRSLLNDYPVETEIDSLWQHYMDILLTLREEEKSLYEISRSDMIFIESMAADCAYGVVNAYSRNLLSMLYDREFEPCDYSETSMKSSPRIQQTPVESVCQIGNVFPIPCVDELYIPYHCSEKQKIRLSVLDNTGRMIFDDVMDGLKSLYTLNTKEIVPGLYHINFVFEDGTQKNVKFIKQ